VKNTIANDSCNKQMKHAFDPLCLLNCDKIVRMVKPTAGEVQEW
jgi:D-lactate dehydrogenase (cytochrome)